MDEVEGRPVVLEALSGSHNYNLNTPNSDRDYKVFVAPTFADLYRGDMIHKEWIGTEKDVLVHDVRKIPELLWKSNPSFMEILFSREVAIPDTFAAPYIEKIYGMRDGIARMNLPYLYDATVGIARGRLGNMVKGTSGTADLVARYGYDTKQAMHCIRNMETLERFAGNGFSNFGKAMWFEGADRDRLLSIKNGAYTLEGFREYAREWFGRAEELKDAYRSVEPDLGTKDELDSLVMGLVKEGVLLESARGRAPPIARSPAPLPVSCPNYSDATGGIAAWDHTCKGRILRRPSYAGTTHPVQKSRDTEPASELCINILIAGKIAGRRLKGAEYGS